MMPGALFGIQGLKFQKQGQNLCHQGHNIEVRGAILGPPGAGFLNYVSPGGETCQVAWGVPIPFFLADTDTQYFTDTDT